MNWAKNNYQVLSKTIKNNHDNITKRLLKRHQELVDAQMERWKRESKKALNDLTRTLKDKKKE